MQRQRVLERAGWVFWRCFASTFIRRRKVMLDDLLRRWPNVASNRLGRRRPRSVHTEHRIVRSVTEPANEGTLMSSEVLENTPASQPAPLLPLFGSAIENKKKFGRIPRQDEVTLDQMPVSAASVGSRALQSDFESLFGVCRVTWE